MENKKFAKEVAFYTAAYLVGFGIWAKSVIYVGNNLYQQCKLKYSAKKRSNEKTNSKN